MRKFVRVEKRLWCWLWIVVMVVWPQTRAESEVKSPTDEQGKAQKTSKALPSAPPASSKLPAPLVSPAPPVPPALPASPAPQKLAKSVVPISRLTNQPSPHAAPQPPSPSPAPTTEATKAPASPVRFSRTSRQAETDFAQAVQTQGAANFALELSGFLQAGYRYTANDPKLLRLGESDGFYVRQARLRVDSTVWKFRAVMTIDGSFDGGPEALSVSPAQRRLSMAMRDAYVSFQHAGFFVAAGQMRVAFGRMNQIENDEQRFAFLPLIDQGEDIAFGYQVRAIVPGRDIGLSAGYDQRFGWFGLHIRAMLYNGNGEGRFGNDSDAPAVAGRLRFDFGKFLSVGGSVLYNPRRVGQDPLLFDETDLVFGADLRFNLAGFYLEGEFAGRTTSFPTLNQPQEFAWGFRVDAGYRIPWVNIEPIVRFEIFDPSDQFDNDQLMYISIGINWYLRLFTDHEFSVRASYTIKIEQTADRTLNNDQFNLILQYRL